MNNGMELVALLAWLGVILLVFKVQDLRSRVCRLEQKVASLTPTAKTD
jgi:hypothetical protein